MPFPEVLLEPSDLSLAIAVSTAATEYNPAIDRLIQQQGIWSSEASFCLQVGLTQALLVRPMLGKSVGELVQAGYLAETGGEVHNPHRRIDGIGAAVAYYYLPHAFPDMPVDIRIEEEGEWRRYPQNAYGDVPHCRIIVDPLDGTGDIPKGRPFQAMGILVTDADGRFVASCVVGLRRPEILVVDDTHATLFDFDEKRFVLTPIPLQLDSGPREAVRVSVLKRRLEEDPGAYAFIDGERVQLVLDTFGGAGLLALAHNEVDAMLDWKGQIWYEAVPWGMTAQQTGCPVTAPDGSAIDFAGMLAESLANPGYKGRQKIVIYRNPEVQAALLEKVRV
ncbi:hypothetical protein HY948_04290 [Candidatus Gottesmanbacteria bacterium]|nr:hypothetical protein [Candidatus Gottesmanbacteria bacterium]